MEDRGISTASGLGPFRCVVLRYLPYDKGRCAVRGEINFVDIHAHTDGTRHFKRGPVACVPRAQSGPYLTKGVGVPLVERLGVALDGHSNGCLRVCDDDRRSLWFHWRLWRGSGRLVQGRQLAVDLRQVLFSFVRVRPTTLNDPLEVGSCSGESIFVSRTCGLLIALNHL